MTEQNEDEKEKLDSLVKNFFNQIGVSTEDIDETIKLGEKTGESRTDFVDKELDDLEMDPSGLHRDRIILLERKINEKNETIMKYELIIKKWKSQIREFENEIAPALIKTIRYYRQKNLELEKTIEKLRRQITNIKSIW